MKIVLMKLKLHLGLEDLGIYEMCFISAYLKMASTD